MYPESSGARAGAALLLLLCLLLLAACTPVPPEKVDQPQPPSQDTAQDPAATAAFAFPTLTPAPAFLAGCNNVRSASFNLGTAVGTRVCVEGIINRINLPGGDNRTTIEFDTATGKTGGSLYGVTVLITDSQSFGLDILNQLVQGERIAVNGQFEIGASYNYVAQFIIEINQPDDLILLT